jgi:phage gp46-like protein
LSAPAFSDHGFSTLSFAVGGDEAVTGGGSSGLVSGARSSALGLADLALTWSNAIGSADLSMIDNDLASDAGLETAVLLSLFTDRRAKKDDVPPSGDPNDRRGWWADQFADIEGDLIGSRLWLLDRAKRTPETARLAEEYVREALAWMLEDRVAASIGVTIDISARDTMLITVTLQRPGRDAVAFRFGRAWDNQTAT